MKISESNVLAKMNAVTSEPNPPKPLLHRASFSLENPWIATNVKRIVIISQENESRYQFLANAYHIPEIADSKPPIPK